MNACLPVRALWDSMNNTADIMPPITARKPLSGMCTANWLLVAVMGCNIRAYGSLLQECLGVSRGLPLPRSRESPGRGSCAPI